MSYENEKKARKIRRIVVYTLATFIFSGLTIGLLYGIRPLLLPFILGAFLAYLLKPIVKSFRGSAFRKYTRAFGLILIISGVVYFGGSIIKSSLPEKEEQLQLKVRLQYRLNERFLSWMGLNENEKGNFIYQSVGKELEEVKKKITAVTRLTEEERKAFLDSYSESSEPEKDKYYNYYLANLKRQKIDIAKVKAQTKDSKVKPPPEEEKNSTLAGVLNALSHWIIFPLAFVLILLDKGHIVQFFIRLIPNRYFELSYTVVQKVDEALGKYIRGTIVESSLVGITLIIGFYLCGLDVQAAIIIGVFGGMINAIPFAGTVLTCFLGAAYSLIAEDVQPILPFINQDNLMLAVIGVVIFAHLLDNAIFLPLVVGSAVNIHPLVVIMGVFGGSIMFGFAGLIFAIPTIVILKVVTETFFRGLREYRII